MERLGAYRVVSRLAVGGMAEVMLAERDGPGAFRKRVVVKRMLPGAGRPDVIAALFRREAELMALVGHQNVVQVIDWGEDVRGLPYLVLEHVDGVDVSRLIDAARPMPLEAALAILEGLCRGLGHLHGLRSDDGRALGLVHRDVSPHNVLVSRDGEVKVADLGVARVDPRVLPTLGGLKGKLAYMPPEQLAGRSVDARSDLFAAGLVAWEVLTGTPLLPPGEAGIDALCTFRSAPPPSLRALRPDVPPALEAAVSLALAPAPEARPVDAAAWLVGLQSAGVRASPEALAAEVSRALTASPHHASGCAAPIVATEDAPRAPRRRAWIAAAVAVAAIGALVLRVVPREELGAGVRPVSFHGPVSSSRLAAPPRPPRRAPEPEARHAALASDIGPAEAAVEIHPPSPVRRPPRPPPPAESAASPQVRIEAGSDGPVHVACAGTTGFAPKALGPLSDGSHVVRLRGPAGPATLRLSVSKGGVTAAVGAPAGRYYLVTCGGRSLGNTPVSGLPVADVLRCRLGLPDGSASTSFGVSVTR